MINEHKFIQDLAEGLKLNQIIEFELSKYLPSTKGKTEYREYFKCNVNEFYVNELKEKHLNYEVALHSRIEISGKTYHIPMVDFNVVSDIEKVKIKFNNLKVLDKPLYIYHSGRSYHGYYLDLLSESQWYKYLGSLLLLNDRKKPFKYIDSRWIGHSLEHGYSALRLTKNTNHYLQVPKLMGIV